MKFFPFDFEVTVSRTGDWAFKKFTKLGLKWMWLKGEIGIRLHCPNVQIQDGEVNIIGNKRRKPN